jgi:hypothetical protein
MLEMNEKKAVIAAQKTTPWQVDYAGFKATA